MNNIKEENDEIIKIKFHEYRNDIDELRVALEIMESYNYRENTKEINEMKHILRKYEVKLQVILPILDTLIQKWKTKA